MANPEHVHILRGGAEFWNRWIDRIQHTPEGPFRADLSGTDFSGADFSRADLRRADLSRGNLSRANLAKLRKPDLDGTVLIGADLRKANLSGVKLSDANLIGADLSGTDFSGSNLSEAKLVGANLNRVDLSRANLIGADLSETNLIGANLSGADLSRGNLIGANFNEADLIGANLIGADLSGTDFIGADLSGTDFSGSNLTEAKLVEANLNGAKLIGANLSGADLSGANLIGANLSGANLIGANLSEANLSEANFSEANLTDTDLRSARLQSATLDRATLTGARLWETQRGGWSIKCILCERVYWDRESVAATQYASGEFERIHSEQMRIELLYEGGITTFELNTLPALLHHLAALHPDAGIRLRAVEQAAGGAMVVINVEHSNAATVEEIRTDAERSQAAQLALRDDSAARWEIEKRLLLDEVFPRMLAAAGQHVHIDGPATGLVIASGYASVTADQTINDLAPIREVLDDVMNRRMEWGLAQGQAEQLERAVRDVQSELQKSQPRHPVVSEGLKAIRDFVVGALGNAAGTALATNTWAPLLDQLARVANLLAR